MWPPPNSRRTWSWFLVACGPGLRQGRKMQREARLGPGGYSKPQQELEPFGPKTRAWTPYSGEGLRLASTCPPATQGPPTPFQKLSDLCGGQACVCPGGMRPGRCTQSGKEPLPQVSPRASPTGRVVVSRHEELEWGRARHPHPRLPTVGPGTQLCSWGTPGSPVGPGWG